MDTYRSSLKIIVLLILFCLSALLTEKALADEFVVDPQIQNSGPIFKLATSDLPKAPLVLSKNGNIDWQRPGVRIEQLRMVAQKVGVRFAYMRYPWKRALKVIEEGHGDAAFVAGYSDARAVWGVYPVAGGKVDASQAISQITYWLYTLRDGPVHWDGKSLTGVATPIGAGVGDIMTAKLKNEGLDIVEISTYQQLALMLKAGRIDAAVSFRSLIDKVIAKDPSQFTEVVKQPIPFRKIDGYLIFSKASYNENRETVEKIWGSIRELWENGTMDQLFAKYDFPTK